jgi:hypothetical protein
VRQGEESLVFNPRRSRHRDQLADDTALLARLEPAVNQIIGMARTVHDRWSDDLDGDPVLDALAEELRRCAHDLRLLVRQRGGASENPSDGASSPSGGGSDAASGTVPGRDTGTATPALTRPVSVLRPHPEHWVLLGALMEDLRRIREEIVGGGGAPQITAPRAPGSGPA